MERLLGLIDSVKQGLINLEQQDAHELYAALVGSFEEVVNRRKTLNLSNSVRAEEQPEVENRLIGFTKSSITCTRCRNEVRPPPRRPPSRSTPSTTFPLRSRPPMLLTSAPPSPSSSARNASTAGPAPAAPSCATRAGSGTPLPA